MNLWIIASHPYTGGTNRDEKNESTGSMITATLIGYLAIAISITSYMLRDDHRLRVLNVISCLFWTSYFVMLGEWTSVASLSLACVMIWGALYGHKRTANVAWYLCIAAIPASFMAVAAGQITMIDTLPFIGGAAINTGVAFLSRGKLTLACAAGECTWGLFAVMIGAWPSAFMALFSLGALAYREFSRFSYERQVGNAPA